MRPLLVSASVLLGLGMLLGCSGAHEPRKEQGPVTQEQPRAQPLLDVPSLLNGTVEDLGRTLGPHRPLPSNFVDPTTMVLMQRGIAVDSSVMFQHRSLQVVASFNNRSRRVLDLLLLGSDEDKLLQEANLNYTTQAYIILPVFRHNQPSKLLGLRVVPRTDL